tara:strand:+ start:1182 stop:2093 length:912 start_codon:yes stop_codon:yes gene_type:complete
MLEENVKAEEQIEEGEVVDLEQEETEPEVGEESPVEEEVVEETAKEPETEESKDELEDYSKNVQKRIATLTKKMREQERAAESAYAYAKSLQEENVKLKENTTQLNTNYQTEAENRLKSQRAQANNVLKSAYQEQDWDKVTKAQEILDKITVEESKLQFTKMQAPAVEEQNQQVIPNPLEQPQQRVEPDPKAEEWAQKNEWFGSDEPMTLVAFNIHNKLLEQGFDPEDSMYYDEIDKQMRAEFPHKFANGGGVETSKIQQTVAPAGRTTNSKGRKQVRLTKSQVEMAKRLNVPLKEYAKHLKG